MSREMNASLVYLLGNLVQEQGLPGFSRWWGCSVRGAGAADHQNFGARSLGQDARERAHEDVVASHRFEVSSDESDDLVRSRELAARRKPKLRVRRRLGQVGIDTFMKNADFVPKFLREGRVLPNGG